MLNDFHLAGKENNIKFKMYNSKIRSKDRC